MSRVTGRAGWTQNLIGIVAGFIVLSGVLYVCSMSVRSGSSAAWTFAVAGCASLAASVVLVSLKSYRHNRIWPVYFGAGLALAGQVTVFITPVSLVLALAGYGLIGTGLGLLINARHESAEVELSKDEPDVLEYRHTMYSLVRAQKMDGLSRLAGGIAHDFNNLLSGVLGYASLMQTFVDENDPVRPYISTIVESAERGAALTKRLLEFAGRRSFELCTINPNQLMKDTVDLTVQTVGSDIDIETDIDDCLPAIEADSGQLQQAIVDLCKNACEAMPDGGTLRVEARRTNVKSPVDLFIGGRMPRGVYVRFSVIDTGVGMAAQDLDRAFEPFYTTKEPGCGSGLGLSSTLGIVHLHKGYIDITSEVGGGTQVDMYLPITSKQVSSVSTIYKPRHNGAGTILVIDDEDIIRRMAADILSRIGYTVILARDGSEGVRAYSQHKNKIDAVVLDYKMPHMNGIETSRHIRRLDPQAHILLATGCAERDTVDGFALDTIDDMLFKPFKQSELTDAIRKITEWQGHSQTDCFNRR